MYSNSALISATKADGGSLCFAPPHPSSCLEDLARTHPSSWQASSAFSPIPQDQSIKKWAQILPD
jgi:hypothetical protein